MKSLRIICLAVLVSTCVSVATAQSFSVAGYGKVFYTPDRFDLTFAVVTEEAEVLRCKEKHLAVLARVKAFLDQQTETMTSLRQDATVLDRVYEPGSSPTRRVFRYTTAFTARLREAHALLPFQEGIVSAGVTDLHGLDLFSSRQNELLDQARREGIKDAKQKAELATKELGWSSLKAMNITFNDESWRKNRASVNYGSRIYAAKPETPADLTTFVESGVSITFNFQSAQ
jgi:uncharacterized protein YggE